MKKEKTIGNPNLYKNIILIGMPGSGKTSIGKVVAQIKSRRFIDTDEYIEKKCRKSISEIINKKGEKKFQSIEEKMIKACAKRLFGSYIIATGGSAVLSPHLMKYLQKNNFIVYLFHTYESLEKRLKNQDITKRGIIGSKTMTFEEIYNRRAPFYKDYANKTVDISNRSFNEAVFDVLKALSQ